MRLLFTTLFLSSLSIIPTFAQDTTSVAESNANVTDLQKKITELEDEIRNNKQLIQYKNNELNQKEAKIAELETAAKEAASGNAAETANLKKQLEEAVAAQKKAEARADSAEIKAKKEFAAEMENITKERILTASNFLYIPYEEYSITNLAIPSFENAKGTPLYDKHQIRLELLKNYKSDVEFLNNFLNSKTVTDFNKASKDAGNDLMKNRAVKVGSGCLNELSSSSAYKNYQKYDDWQKTYLGKYMVVLSKEFKNPTPQSPAQIEKIKKLLEAMLQPVE